MLSRARSNMKFSDELHRYQNAASYACQLERK
jgi:hypothetical protein